MTILTIKNQLLTHFMTNDTFDFTRHALNLNFDKEVSNFREEMVTAACQELEKMGLIKRMESKDSAKEIWILIQPLSAFTQQVSVGPITANMVALAVNHYNELEGMDGRCDMSNINELDILRLVQIIGNYEEAMNSIDDDKEEEEENR